MASEPRLDLRLQADRLCFLNREPRFSLVVLLTLTNNQSITLVRNDTGGENGLRQMLASQCIECTDAESGEHIPVLDGNPESPKPNAETECPPLMTLEPRKAKYMTFTTAKEQRDYEFAFDISALHTNRTYKIQCKPSELPWWTLKSPGQITEYYNTHNTLPNPETPPLYCEPKERNIITFSTRDAKEEAPTVSVSISAPQTLSISGSPKYNYTLEFTSHAAKPITVLAERDSAKAGNSDMAILDATTGKRVAPDLIDDGNKDGPWLRREFLRLEPGMPYVEDRVFDGSDRYSGLDDLEIDKEYLLRMAESQWWWTYDGIDTVMGYAGDRGSGGLGPAENINVRCEKVVKFRTVA